MTKFAKAKGKGSRPLTRKETKSRVKKIIAYDLETTRIREGTPAPLYITAHGEDFGISSKVRDMKHLRDLLETRLLTDENIGARFVAWNGNNFDVYLVAAALLQSDDYVLRPYLTRSKALRGLRVQVKGEHKKAWEFLDGIAMTGLAGFTLEKFLKVFAPDYLKMTGVIDWEKEGFDGDNPKHVLYAERDSEGLYHGIMKAQTILRENFGIGLYPTIGNTGIRTFMRNMPLGVNVWQPPGEPLELIRNTVMRGGYCFLMRKYAGPIWKYDINQAYAAAMRETALPAGRCMHGGKRLHPYAPVFIARVSANNPHNAIPFYYRDLSGASVFGIHDIGDTWLTSVEYNQLLAEGWRVQITDSYFWDENFTMREFVDRLEYLRMNAPGGANGAQGMMMKAIGNNSYGKTVERLEGLELILAKECPEGFFEYQAEDDLLQHIFFKINKPVPREYHQPQIGAFITAYVRMVVRRAALQNPGAFIYADTDCVVFSEPVHLKIDPSRYGYWKVEVEGEHYRFIQKKVYAKFGAEVKHAKGLNVKRLTDDDFKNWFNGEAPVQTQVQKNNFVKVMTGAEMFVTRIKRGEVFTNSIGSRNVNRSVI